MDILLKNWKYCIQYTMLQHRIWQTPNLSLYVLLGLITPPQGGQITPRGPIGSSFDTVGSCVCLWFNMKANGDVLVSPSACEVYKTNWDCKSIKRNLIIFECKFTYCIRNDWFLSLTWLLIFYLSNLSSPSQAVKIVKICQIIKIILWWHLRKRELCCCCCCSVDQGQFPHSLL